MANPDANPDTSPICDQLLSTGKCPESDRCVLRHPGDCEHWTGDIRGCPRGNLCMYLHNYRKKGINIKINKGNHETEIGELNRISEKEISTKRTIYSLNEALAAKEKIILDNEKDIAKLGSEIESLSEHDNKMKRKIHQEITALRSKQN